LDAAIRELHADARIEYHQTVDGLRKKRDDVKQKLTQIKATSEDAWGELKNGVDRVWTDIEETIESTKSALTKSE
jgi:hypothetical protein